MDSPNSRRGNFFARVLCLLVALLPAHLFAQAPREYSIRDQGKTRTFEIAQDELTRGFTDDECRQYLHLDTCPAQPSG